MILTHRREHLESEQTTSLIALLMQRGDTGPFDVGRAELVRRIMGEGEERPAAVVESTPIAGVWFADPHRPGRSVCDDLEDLVGGGVWEFQVTGETGWFTFQRLSRNDETGRVWIDCYGGTGGRKGSVAFRSFGLERPRRNEYGKIKRRKRSELRD